VIAAAILVVVAVLIVVVRRSVLWRALRGGALAGAVEQADT
jgi:hypothetical protein